MKKFADKHHTKVSFEEENWVFVKLQPYCQHSITLRRNEKLSMRYFKPFPIIQKIGVVAYRLQLPKSVGIHLVFHVSFEEMCGRSH